MPRFPRELEFTGGDVARQAYDRNSMTFAGICRLKSTSLWSSSPLTAVIAPTRSAREKCLGEWATTRNRISLARFFRGQQISRSDLAAYKLVSRS